MPADLRLVTNATHGDAHERPAQRARDRLAQRRLADARRPDQPEDRTGAAAAGRRTQTPVATQHAHGQEFEDAFLHVVESVVVGVQYGTRGLEVGVFGDVRAPRDVEHRVEPVAHPSLLGILRTHTLELVELLVDRGANLIGQVERVGPGAVLRGRVIVALAQLLADGVHLAAQQHLALLLVDAFGHLVADAVLELQRGQGLTRP